VVHDADGTLVSGPSGWPIRITVPASGGKNGDANNLSEIASGDCTDRPKMQTNLPPALPWWVARAISRKIFRKNLRVIGRVAMRASSFPAVRP
jgi:hypothetical protein